MGVDSGSLDVGKLHKYLQSEQPALFTTQIGGNHVSSTIQIRQFSHGQVNGDTVITVIT